VLFGDHVTEIDADAELDPLSGSNTGVTLGHTSLYLDRTAHRIDNAVRLRQEAVARVFD
jgi:hypothetical protein